MAERDGPETDLRDAQATIDLGGARAAPAPAVAGMAGLPAPAPPAAGARARFARTPPPGRVAGAAEASAMLRGVAPAGPEEAATLARRMAEIAASGLVPETTNAQARAHLARRRAAAMPGPEPLRVAGPAPARIAGPARQALPAPDAPDAEGLPVPAPARGPAYANLPAALARREVAATDPAWLSDGAQPRWLKIYETPRYLQDMIRALGEQTFRRFPCYAHHYAAAQAAGEDPLGSISLVGNIGGRGPNPVAEVDAVAGWIRDNGVLMAASQLAFPTMQGYEPRVILAAHGGTSFLLVEEKKETGAPADARYVYAWKGGMDFYLSRGGALGTLRGLRAVEGPAAPGRAPPAPAAALAFRTVTVDPAEERRKRALRIKALPQAEAAPVSSELLRAARSLGFKTVGTPDGPALRLDSPEGTFMLMPAPGGTLPDSAAFRARRTDAEPGTEDVEVACLADIEAFVEGGSSPAP